MADETETTPVEEPQDITGLFDDDTRTEEGAEAAESGSEVETGEQSTEGEQTTEGKSDETESEGEQAEGTDSETPSETEEESADDKGIPRAALLEERRKRQQAQEELDRLKREYGVQQEDNAPDPRDDPEAYEKYVRDKVEKENWEKRVTTSRERMLEQHSDFEEKERHFVQLAQQDPDLVKQMNEHPDPAAFAYEKANESLKTQEQQIEQRVMERLRQEGKLKDESEKSGKSKGSADAASKVSDLTSAAGAGPNSGEGEAVESTDPADVFGDLSY